MEVKVVIGANYGDEGKGLVSGHLAHNALKNKKRSLTVFYNGTVQRAHSYGDKVYHCEAAGTEFGSDTFYHHKFVISPISLWIAQAKVYIDPYCRVILPCDVMANRTTERARGKERHGSCGFGLYEAVKRSENSHYCVHAIDLLDPFVLYQTLQHLKDVFPYDYDEVYNLDNFMKAADYIRKNCEIISFTELISRNQYDTIIYEGGQGLLLDQDNKNDFPHLTPSSVGMTNIIHDIHYTLKCEPEIYYVSRSYITRHGAGPMEAECDKVLINPNIIDKVNQMNEWQGALRFGRLNLDSLYKRIQANAANSKNINLVFTQLNYTNGKLATTDGFVDIEKPDFCTNLYVSDNKTHIELYN